MNVGPTGGRLENMERLYAVDIDDPTKISSSLVKLLESLGGELVAWRRHGATAGTWHGAQFKAEADMRANDFLVSGLASATPGIPVVSEEDASFAVSRPKRYWLVDPIDGTASWAGGFPGFVTQAALMESDEPVLAAIVAPALGLTFTARRGHGAFLNGAPLAAGSRGASLRLIDNYPTPRGVAAAAMTGLGCTGYVECGSLALKMCRVVDGTADLFIKDVAVMDWDMAAPALVVSEAGGCFLRLDGSPWRFDGPMGKFGGIVVTAEAAVAQRAIHWHAAGARP
ncbi:inositol monophosphatase family protein [Falsiroseomonas sp.]|uniref:inositol monophosphatase family protein n=1 Tax=Falsiroseomonas sp. TaxID=2870721 RepID=UPI0034A2AF46